MNIAHTLRQRRLNREASRKKREEILKKREPIVQLKIDLVRMQIVHRKEKVKQEFTARWNVEVDAWRPKTPGRMVYEERKLREGIHPSVIRAGIDEFFKKQLNAEMEFACMDLYADLCDLHRTLMTRDEAEDLRTLYALNLAPSITLHQEFAQMVAPSALAA